MSGHQSGGVVLTEAERHELAYVGCSHHKADSASFVCWPCAVAEIETVERVLTARLAAQAGRVAEVVEKAAREHGPDFTVNSREKWVSCLCDAHLPRNLLAELDRFVAAAVAEERERIAAAIEALPGQLSVSENRRNLVSRDDAARIARGDQ